MLNLKIKTKTLKPGTRQFKAKLSMKLVNHFTFHKVYKKLLKICKNLFPLIVNQLSKNKSFEMSQHFERKRTAQNTKKSALTIILTYSSTLVNEINNKN